MLKLLRGSLIVSGKFKITSLVPFRAVQHDCKFRVKTSEQDVKKIRNIGIIAHIDAGKTTTTERMLYYSGLTDVMGEVHDGDTVMDYMAQERERGITITSAAITFSWKNHRINLIDTPGHVDFTIEVERSLSVLDGGVVLLDSSAGVEVQTVTVWNQANRHHIPCIIYLNKMDKVTSDVDMCLSSLKQKLKVNPLLLQIPVGVGKNFTGIINIISMQKFIWDTGGSDKPDGMQYRYENLDSNDELWPLAARKREELIERIIDLDDELANKYILEGVSSLTVSDIHAAIKRIVFKRTGAPVFCGSSYKNIGVQPLLDAVVMYLPNPTEKWSTNFLYDNDNSKFCGFVFKILHHKKRGPLTFLRLCSGNIENGQKLYNANRNITEKVGNLLIPFADDFKEVNSLSYGNIAVVSGLKEAVTGDTLLASNNLTNEVVNMGPVIQVPDPVFFCSIEPPSVGAQKQLDYALKCLQREDPTFRVEHDEDLGQTILSGMGELHIDIIKERIAKEYGVEAYLGALQVAYKETVEKMTEYTHILNKTLGKEKHFVKITLAISSSPQYGKFKEAKVCVTKFNELGNVRADHLKAVNSGIGSALNHGPVLGFPVIDIKVNLLWLEIGKNTSLSMISAAASQCTQKVVQMSEVHLLEPVMFLSIAVNKGYAGSVINDLSYKRSQILSVECLHDVETILSKTPLNELRGYSTTLRAITAGTCNFTIEFDSYEKMDDQQQAKAIAEITGFPS